jgi:diguanylate cyclase (GGDEF)-like protein
MYRPNPALSGKILVIDDDPLIGKLIKKLLEKKGHKVITAVSGEDALKIIPESGFDIVITDVKLPMMDGMAVLDRIKELDDEIDVIVITGFGSIESAVSFMKAGALDYISKPINSDHLEIIIEKALERKELIMASRERDHYLKMSLTDALTGIFNHKYFHEHLGRELLHCRRKSCNCSVMLVDIDNFKTVNDSFGHQVGDKVLQLLSTDIIKACRSHDTVARYGGEEFAIILPDTDTVKSETVAGRVLNTVASRRYNPLSMPVTVSIGISNFPAHAQDKDELIKMADIALYHSKGRGKNCYTVFDEGIESCICR